MLRSIVILGGLILVGAGSPAAAERVDSAACKGFELEKAALEKAGIAEDVAKGPEWAKTNLAPDRLRKVGRFIHLDEQLKFRCPDVIAAAAVRQMEEQARLRALAALERARLWEESMKKVVPPERKPKTKVAEIKKRARQKGIPPLPERKSR
ncbi:MAG: hypothetical protein K0U74_07125 [Alphaproteobacteria bacterium]|nr:hypothetical protein [Alphaproteobacteria bacterium]